MESLMDAGRLAAKVRDALPALTSAAQGVWNSIVVAVDARRDESRLPRDGSLPSELRAAKSRVAELEMMQRVDALLRAAEHVRGLAVEVNAAIAASKLLSVSPG